MGAGRENARLSRGRGGDEYRRGGGRAGAKAAAALAALALLGWGACVACARLHAAWTAQCAVTDVASQVKVVASPHVSEEVVRGLFGLTNGCNLAEIDFEALRAKALREQPIIRSLSVVRSLPDRVSISVEERKPIARVNYTASKVKMAGGRTVEMPRWDVVDAEGVVFNYKLDDSKLLPRIVENRPGAKRGERLSGRALSAARLVELGSRREFAPLRLHDVVVTNATYLIAATEDYSLVKIDWNFVDDPAASAQPHLENALAGVLKASATGLAGSLRNVFTVTETGRVSALPYDREPTR